MNTENWKFNGVSYNRDRNIDDSTGIRDVVEESPRVTGGVVEGDVVLVCIGVVKGNRQRVWDSKWTDTVAVDGCDRHTVDQTVNTGGGGNRSHSRSSNSE